ncbi:MAG: tetratricopeptide repeat protein [Chloroflexi bacterium]|nr:tetratricopeptide repeat protein [Chloroflexota bacterium]MBP8058475.1 tetratricopeptide repeat protein [Chloroflexota bacterium]
MAKKSKKNGPPSPPRDVRKGCRSGLNTLGVSILLTLVVALVMSWLGRGRVDDPFAPQIEAAETHLDNEEYAQAIAVYSDIITQDPSHILAHWSRGVTYFEMEDYAAAITDYSWVIDQGETGNPVIFLLRAEAYAANDQLDLALADYDTLLASEADDELKAEAQASRERLLGEEE